jgi:hypothetical protein
MTYRKCQNYIIGLYHFLLYNTVTSNEIFPDYMKKNGARKCNQLNNDGVKSATNYIVESISDITY